MTNPTDPEQQSKMHILFIAGNPAFRPVVTRFLGECEELSVIDILPASEKVLAQAQDLQPQVILLDLDTSDPTGLETLINLRTLLPEVGIIALSLLDAGGYQQAVLAAGANDLVLKNNLSTDLFPAIRRAARDDRDGSEHMS
jgi:DNA-binding NarL/FixJ family response regulator